MLKNLLVIIVLFGLIGWGIYNAVNGGNNTEKQQTVLKNNMTDSTTDKGQGLKVGIQEGNIAPDFQLTTLDGNVVKLSDQKGKKIFLNFWASWCPPCKAEMPFMEDFYKEQKNNSIEILAVNLTTAEKNKDNVLQFVKAHSLTFPILLDEKGEIGDTFQAITIPTTYIIDSNGVIQEKVIGPMSKEMMEKFTKNIQ